MARLPRGNPRATSALHRSRPEWTSRPKTPMDQPSDIFHDELLDRAEDIPEQRFSRAEDMSEAAHEAYQATVDRLVRQLDLGEAEALALTKAFVSEVKSWIEEDTYDWDELRERLERAQETFDPTAA